MRRSPRPHGRCAISTLARCPSAATTTASRITDRDITVRCVAEGRDPTTTRVGDFAEGKPVTIGADDSVEEVLRRMSSHGVRRLPVIDGYDLVGMVSQADVARSLPRTKSATWSR
jgi:predicted transcriptional regulator